MPRRFAWLTILGISSWASSDAKADGTEDSVVRVFASLRAPDVVRPWSKRPPVEVGGTGTVIDGKRILTNAHLVQYAGEVFVQDRRGGDRFEAKVVSFGTGIDLAVLVPEDEGFFQDHPPISRAEKYPTAGASVDVLGFPIGGAGMATTKGTLSRVDFVSYDDQVEGLRIQIDASINPGNSGGPALVGGKLIGLVYGLLGGAEKVGYVIPNEEIDAYLEDVKDGRYDGKPRVEDHFQALENEALRARLGLNRADRGVMVRKPARPDPSWPLREGDVVVRVGDRAVDNDGLVDFGRGLRLPFMALVPQLAGDGKIPVRLIREGKSVEASLPVIRHGDRLFKPLNGRYPDYFMHGPLVFSTLSSDTAAFFMRGGPATLMGSPILARASDREAFPGEGLVVVTAPLLPHRITRGYGDPFGLIVKDVDGVAIKNLKHLVELLRDGTGDFVTFKFHGDYSETLVFRREAIEEATPLLMAEHGIPARGSAEPLSVWRKRQDPPR